MASQIEGNQSNQLRLEMEKLQSLMLFPGVRSAPCKDCIPGSIIIYGSSMYPLLCGSRRHEVVMCAGTHGKGKVFVTSHDRFTVNFISGQEGDRDIKRLHGNIYTWMGCEGGAGSTGVHDLCKLQDVHYPDTSIVVWSGGFVKYGNSKDFVNKLLDYIAAGGNLVYGMCPWGWLQLQPSNGSTLADMPLYGLLSTLGVFFTTACMDMSGCEDAFQIPQQLAKVEESHFGYLLNKFVTRPFSDCLPYLSGLSHGMNWIPEDYIHSSGDMKKQLTMIHAAIIEYQESNDICCVPSSKKPVSDGPARSLLCLLCKLSQFQLNPSLRKCVGIEYFPGDVSPDCVCENDREWSNEIVSVECRWLDVHPTGYYLPAGNTLHLTVLSMDCSLQQWSVQVGSHTDDLTSIDEPLRRIPNIVVRSGIRPGSDEVTQVYSPYGGLVYLESPVGGGHITCVISRVIHSPFLRTHDTESVSQWEQRSSLAPGPWADICGRYLMVTLPSASVRHLSAHEVCEVMGVYDEVMLQYHNLRGTDVTAVRRQWLVADEQPCVGYMHAGYPIVTHLDVADPTHQHFLLSKECLREKGSWGLYHELGHNMQRDVWTFNGTGEVTCNIFTLFAMNTISKQPIWIHPWLQDQIQSVRKYFNAGANFEDWKKDPGVALFIYAQLAHQFGWETYATVFREYESMPEERLPLSEDDKIATWLYTFSVACKHNLAPLFKFWGLPLPSKKDKLWQALGKLPPYLPDDDITRFDKDRFQRIRDEYPECIVAVVTS